YSEVNECLHDPSVWSRRPLWRAKGDETDGSVTRRSRMLRVVLGDARKAACSLASEPDHAPLTETKAAVSLGRANHSGSHVLSRTFRTSQNRSCSPAMSRGH